MILLALVVLIVLLLLGHFLEALIFALALIVCLRASDGF